MSTKPTQRPSEGDLSPEQHRPSDGSVQGPLSALAAEIAEINRAAGWFDSERSFGDDIALLHSEVSEAYEEFRKNNEPGTRYYSGGGYSWFVPTREEGTHTGGPTRTVLNKPEGVPSELADVLVRLLDTCHRYGIDLDEVLAEKMAFNRTRGHRHGGKRV